MVETHDTTELFGLNKTSKHVRHDTGRAGEGEGGEEEGKKTGVGGGGFLFHFLLPLRRQLTGEIVGRREYSARGERIAEGGRTWRDRLHSVPFYSRPQ